MVKRVPTIARFSGGLLCPIDLKLKTLRSYAACVCVSLSLSARESVGRVCVRACMNTHTHIRNSTGHTECGQSVRIVGTISTITKVT